MSIKHREAHAMSGILGMGTSHDSFAIFLGYLQNGTYQVTLKAYSNVKSCENKITQSVSVLNLDKILMSLPPNGDGKNDTFVVGIPTAQLNIQPLGQTSVYNQAIIYGY
ncbi:MAG: hypothetical protein R2822_29440 [Spirosomataceae bacterium]